MFINIIITKIRQFVRLEIISNEGAESTKEGRSKLYSPNNSSFSNGPNGNISVVHVLQNQETSSGSFSSSLYSEAEMPLHFK